MVHEVTRVFGDCLNNVVDQKWFEELVCSLLTRNFGCYWTSESLFHGSCPLIF
jgi:hypothetical protein